MDLIAELEKARSSILAHSVDMTKVSKAKGCYVLSVDVGANSTAAVCYLACHYQHLARATTQTTITIVATIVTIIVIFIHIITIYITTIVIFVSFFMSNNKLYLHHHG